MKHRRGLTLIETVLSLLILGGAFVALLDTVGSARAAQATAAERQYARELADDLMAEVLAVSKYKDDLADLFGPELDEITGDRTKFDDVNDFNLWKSTPPTHADGTAVEGAEGLTRTVEVKWNSLSDLRTRDNFNDTGLVIITVTVWRGNKKLAQHVAYRSDVWQAPEDGY